MEPQRPKMEESETVRLLHVPLVPTLLRGNEYLTLCVADESSGCNRAEYHGI